MNLVHWVPHLFQRWGARRFKRSAAGCLTTRQEPPEVCNGNRMSGQPGVWPRDRNDGARLSPKRERGTADWASPIPRLRFGLRLALRAQIWCCSARPSCKPAFLKELSQNYWPSSSGQARLRRLSSPRKLRYLAEFRQFWYAILARRFPWTENGPSHGRCPGVVQCAI